MSTKKQVWLQKKSCHACSNRWPHMGHIFHLNRSAVDSVAIERQQGFFSYFWCDGLEVAE